MIEKANPKWSRRKESHRIRFNKIPNPTNFSNFRSQKYLAERDRENLSPNNAAELFAFPKDKNGKDLEKSGGMCATVKKKAPELSPCCLHAISQREMRTPISRIPVTVKASKGGTRLMWEDPGNSGKAESPRQCVTKPTKLHQKVLSRCSDLDIECTLTINPTLGGEVRISHLKDLDDLLSKKKDDKENIPAFNSRRYSEKPKPQLPLSLNLEDLINAEASLWKILEGLRIGQNISENCEKWWKQTTSDFLFIFKDQIQKLKEGMSLEAISVGLAQYLSNDPQIISLCFSSLKNLIFYVHQNHLLICEILLQKITIDSSNTRSKS